MTLIFFLFFLLPDDPANLHRRRRRPQRPDAQVVQNIREKYGLDKPVIVQYGKYLGKCVARSTSARRIATARRSRRS